MQVFKYVHLFRIVEPFRFLFREDDSQMALSTGMAKNVIDFATVFKDSPVVPQLIG